MFDKPGSEADRRSDSAAPLPCFRLPLHLKQVGAGKHRSGWPAVIECLRHYHHPDAVVLDDFVERSFRDPATARPWREPWVGIFHHPPDLPAWFDPSARLQAIISTRAFRASLRHLKGAIALCEYSGNWLRTRLPCPVLVLKHPTEVATLAFSIAQWEARARPVVQVGWYARNVRAIFQVEVPEGFRKILLMQDRFAKAIELTDQFSPHRKRPWSGEVDIVRRLTNLEYDELLASSLIFNEYWDVSASNTIVEAIARSTPLLVNRHPAIEEYLGRGYPLFFEELREVRGILADPARMREAWQYLLQMDKEWLSITNFARDVAGFVRSVD
jgi:hypothetical protein